jgi:hypothetical protein
MKPIDVLAGVDPGLDRVLCEGSCQEMNVGTLASFIMNYTIYAYPNKEKLKKSLQVIHYKKFCEAKDKKEPNYDHNSVNEFFTASDLAIVFWIYENSYLDWVNKMKNPSLKYKSKTKWTSDRKKPAMEDRDDTGPGVIAYNKCLDWSRELKKLKDTKEYGLLQHQCNKKAGARRRAVTVRALRRQRPRRYWSRHLSLSLTTMRPFLLWKFKWFGMGTIVDVWGK